MDEGKIIRVPTALISVSGLESLTRLEMNLWWKLINIVQDDKSIIQDVNGIIAKVYSGDLLEDGEEGRTRLIERLRKLSGVLIEANLDGRDRADVWRIGMRLVSEYEVKSNDAYIYISIGHHFYRAMTDRQTYTRIREAALFAMNGSKYSSRLYQVIRDKMNLREYRWVCTYDELRVALQVKEDTYQNFGDFRIWVLDAAIKEVNELSELQVSWEPHNKFRKKVLELSIEWELKEFTKAKATAKQLSRHSSARGKQQDTIFVQSDLVRRAIKELSGSDFSVRQKWADEYVSRYGKWQQAMAAVDNLGKWVDDAIASVMQEDGFI